MNGTTNSDQYVPRSVHEMVGYLASIVRHAAEKHPNDEDFARGVAAYEAWETAQGWDGAAGTEQVTQ